MKKLKTPPSFRVQAALTKLGEDIAIARKRRQFTQQRLADGASVNVATIRRLEQGNSGVSLGALAMILLTLGETERLSNLLDMGKDDVGLMLSAQKLPKRVRTGQKAKAPLQGDIDDPQATESPQNMRQVPEPW